MCRCKSSGNLPKRRWFPTWRNLRVAPELTAVEDARLKYLGKILGKKGLPGGLGKFLGGN